MNFLSKISTKLFRPKIFSFNKRMTVFEAQEIFKLKKYNKRELKDKHLELIKVYHPDTFFTPTMSTKINEAKKLLEKIVNERDN